MRMTKCGWKIANDTMQMITSLWGKINLRCFLKVFFVNKPSHLIETIELRSGEDQYFIFNPKQTQTVQNILKPARRIQKTTGKPWSKNNWLDLYRSTLSFLHYIEDGLSLSTIKQISNAEKHEETSSRNGFAYLSRILPAPRMFRWAYVNPEKVFYCSYKMTLNTTSKTVESILISSGFNSNDWEKEKLRTKFYTGKTILENLPGEINATIIK